MNHGILYRIARKSKIPSLPRSLPVLTRSCLIALIALIVALQGSDAQARFRPKEYDLTLVTQFTNCSTYFPQQGLCQGGNWAIAFTTAFYYNTCLQSFDYTPPFSSGELLKCATNSFDKCANIPQDLSIIDTLKNYMMSLGLPSPSCVAYKQTLSPTLNATCPSTCDDGSAKVAGVPLTDFYELPQSGFTDGATASVQDQIVDYGAVVMAIRDVPSLNENLNGTYTSTTNEQTFGVRFLVIVGWSTTASGEVIWKVLNTTGEQSGQTGRISISSLNPNILKYYGFYVILF